MSNSLLYLVRHAAVTVRGDIPTREWELSRDGEEAARGLGEAPEWKSLAAIASSREAKAIATARPIASAAGLVLRTESALGEVDRGATPLMTTEEYGALVAAHFAAPRESVAGWERGADATARICACIEQLVSEVEGPLCVVSHGLVLSHYLAHLRGMPAPAFDEWRAISLPAIAVVDVKARRLLTPFVRRLSSSQ